MNSFFSDEELQELGLKAYGKNVLISKKCSIYGASNIQIGNNVRIDDFCILSGRIVIGSNIHISAYTGIFAGHTGVFIEDYATISSRIMVYAESDDYTGETMTNPMIPDEYRGVTKAAVTIRKNVIVGSGCTILPGVTIDEGASVGSMSLVNKSLEAWSVYVGIPCRKIKDRKKHLLELEKKSEELYSQDEQHK
jgi:galactoside O-acetyltransferase